MDWLGLYLLEKGREELIDIFKILMGLNRVDMEKMLPLTRESRAKGLIFKIMGDSFR